MTAPRYPIQTHRAPDGRTFQTFTTRCVHLDPCWRARCECGTLLSSHDFSRESAEACALQAMGREAPLLDAHGRCSASRL